MMEIEDIPPATDVFETTESITTVKNLIAVLDNTNIETPVKKSNAECVAASSKYITSSSSVEVQTSPKLPASTLRKWKLHSEIRHLKRKCTRLSNSLQPENSLREDFSNEAFITFCKENFGEGLAQLIIMQLQFQKEIKRFSVIPLKVESLAEDAKYCVICVDEMSLKTNLFYNYNRSDDYIIDFYQNNGSNIYKPATCASVIMVWEIKKMH
ncbi:hypothetical protein ILUMI_23634 [Ignelater luminosus]|uniref:Transposable element P transposase-like RNase H domain-containing protein n=1 Tax=Ignelater luminosus TaxID=2038154 RepID=A0A8K0CEY5_IGNLU|nr:hypothetical protein ILUMI_23634 [Ignelater luminosus]